MRSRAQCAQFDRPGLRRGTRAVTARRAARQVGETYKQYTVFEILVHCHPGSQWVVLRRFKNFETLHKRLKVRRCAHCPQETSWKRPRGDPMRNPGAVHAGMLLAAFSATPLATQRTRLSARGLSRGWSRRE